MEHDSVSALTSVIDFCKIWLPSLNLIPDHSLICKTDPPPNSNLFALCLFPVCVSLVHVLTHT